MALYCVISALWKIGIPSMSEVYEQLGELVKGFVFDAGRLGVVRDVEMLNPI